jgi:hypothetical protein
VLTPKEFPFFVLPFPFLSYAVLVMKCSFVPFCNRDLAQNKLNGDIPRLIYWNGVLQSL